MSVVELLVFSIMCYSISYGWIESPLFKDGKLHELASLVHPYLTICFHCVGFWVGAITGIFYFDDVGVLTSGLLGSGACLIIDKIMLWFESGIKG